jgi:hypothetical protein
VRGDIREDGADKWDLLGSERERGKSVGLYFLGWFGCWADSVPGRPRLPFSLFFFFFFLFLFF